MENFRFDYTQPLSSSTRRAEFKRNRDLVCKLLAEHKVPAVLMRYSGYSDSGCVDAVWVLNNSYGDDIDDAAASEGLDESKALTTKLRTTPLPPELAAATGYTTNQNVLDWVGDMLMLVTPDGFELDDGGDGYVLLNVKTKAVQTRNRTITINTEYDSIED